MVCNQLRPLFTAICALSAAVATVHGTVCASGTEACGVDTEAVPAAANVMMQSRKGSVVTPIAESTEDDSGSAVESTQGRSGTGNLSTPELLADTNLMTLEMEVDGNGNISRGAWMQAFSRLDKDGVGSIGVGELKAMETLVSAKPGSSGLRRWNLTRAQYRTGVALAANWFPDYASRLIAHETVVVELAYQGLEMPSDAPEPEDPLEGIVVTPTSKEVVVPATMDLLDLNSTFSDACIGNIVKTTKGTISLLFGLLGLRNPSGQLVANQLARHSWVFSGIAAHANLIAAAKESLAPYKAAIAIKDIFMTLHDSGIFSKALRNVFNNLNWWNALSTVVQVGAIVAAWLGTGSVAFVAQIVLIVLDAIKITLGAIGCSQTC